MSQPVSGRTETGWCSLLHLGPPTSHKYPLHFITAFEVSRAPTPSRPSKACFPECLPTKYREVQIPPCQVLICMTSTTYRNHPLLGLQTPKTFFTADFILTCSSEQWGIFPDPHTILWPSSVYSPSVQVGGLSQEQTRKCLAQAQHLLYHEHSVHHFCVCIDPWICHLITQSPP